MPIYEFRVRQIPPWKLALMGAAAIVAVGGVLLLSGALLLVLAPIAIGAFALNRLFGPKRPAMRRGEPGVTVIEGRYEVVDDKR